MNKLKKYVDNIGLENEIDTGGNAYFYNVDPFYCNVMYITVYWQNDTKSAMETAGKLKRVKTYCKRYGFTIKRLNSPVGLEWYQIIKTSDLETMQYYDKYMNLSVASCEKLMHENHINPVLSDTELNARLKEIMDFFGENLKAFFNSIAA